jgi:hypothetical protein
MNQMTKLGESNRLSLEKIAQKSTVMIDVTSYGELREKYKNLPETISDIGDMAVVSNFLIDINAETKIMDKLRLEATLEARTVTNNINAAFEPYIVEMKEMKAITGDRILAYNREQERIARQAQERLEAERRAEQERLDKEREEKQKDAIFPEEVPEVKVKPVPQFVPMIGTVKTDSGSVGTISIVSHSKIQAAIDSGVREIAGVKIYEVWMFEVVEASQVPKEYREDRPTTRRK